jgi:hypothetical protein
MRKLSGGGHGIREATLASLLDRRNRFMQSPLDLITRRLGVRQLLDEFRAIALPVIGSRDRRATQPCPIGKKRRVSDQSMEAEIDGPERHPGLGDIVAGAEHEGRRRQFLVPVSDDHNRDVDLPGRHVLQNRQGIQPWMAVLNEDQIERRGFIGWKRGVCAVRLRDGLEHFEGPAGSSETLRRKCSIAYIKEPQAPWCRRSQTHSQGLSV